MRRGHILILGLAGTLLLGPANVAPALGQVKGGGDIEPMTLRLGSLEAPETPWHDVLVAMAADLADRPGSPVAIEVLHDVELADPSHPEQDVLHQLADGRLDLALVPSRAWADVGVSSVRALQAPFLIDDDALAVAVAKSDIASRMLDGMTSAGFLGLAMWPDDLRHPIAYDCDINAFLRPTDMAGLRIRAVPSVDGDALLEAFGAEPVFETFGDGGCLLAGHESGLKRDLSPPTATATGNVTFFTRMYVLAGNAEALERLSGEQVGALRDAALTARDAAIERRVSDVEMASTWCEEWGQAIVHADPDDLPLWMAAASDVTDSLRADATTAGFMDDIAALAARTPPAPPAGPCSGDAGDLPDAGDDDVASSASGWATGRWPDGVYRMELTRDQVLERGMHDLLGMVGINTLTITGDSFRIDIGAPDAGPRDCHGRAWVRDGVMHTTWVSTAICGGWADLRWRLVDGALILGLVDSNAPEVDRVWFESNPWSRIE